jgi:hypothetical protein
MFMGIVTLRRLGILQLLYNYHKSGQLLFLVSGDKNSVHWAHLSRLQTKTYARSSLRNVVLLIKEGTMDNIHNCDKLICPHKLTDCIKLLDS